ncbi:hypothetical protein [Aquisalimonas sp.]|uniref:hypothetical protein n=1 Tax=Aquisalimonas sp. TaxID=1872621 RepID=UPI0025C608E3|nr:hypothetical protein [Aquisalimonas sp.]
MTSTATAAPGLAFRARSPLAYMVLLSGLFGSTTTMAWVGAPAAAAAIVLSWPDLRFVARVLLLIGSVGATVTALVEPALLSEAAANLTSLAALVIAVMLFSGLLTGTRDLGLICRRLFAGPPTARYASITFGTGFLAIPLNFGAVGVVGSLVHNELEHAGDGPSPRNAARATLRGFGSASFCSPLSVAVAITLTFLPGLAALELLAVTFPLAVGYLLLGLAFREREAFAASTAPTGNAHVAPMLRLASTIAAVSVAVLLLHNLADVGYAHAVALACSVTVIIGLAASGVQEGRAPAVPSLAGVHNEVAIMGGSAFLGVLASGVALSLLGPGFGLPSWAPPLVALGVPWVLFIGGILGLNPIVTGTLVGGVLGPIWPTAGVLGLGVSMLVGWGITVAGTPYSAAALILNRLTGYDNVTAALRWNRSLSVTALLAGGGLGAVLTYLLAGA